MADQRDTADGVIEFRRPDEVGASDTADRASAAELSGELSKEVEFAAAERMTFFSDAVVAIAITLLALDLPLPTGRTASDLLASFWSSRADFLAFLISFVVIAGHWGGHHRVFKYVLRMDNRLRGIDMLWLLTMVITPFVTRVLSPAEPGPGQEPDTSGPLRFAIYAGVQVVANLTFGWMVHHMVARRLLRTDTPAGLAKRTYWQVGGVAAGFGLSIPLFFVFDSAWIFWFLPVVLGLWSQGRRSRMARSGRVGTG